MDELKTKIIQKCLEVREAQKKYFATRDNRLLHKCKFLEKEIDKLLEIYVKKNTEQKEI